MPSVARESGACGTAAGPTFRHILPCAEPFAWQPLFRALAAHAVPGLEEAGYDADGGAWVRRLVPVPFPDAGPAEVRIRFGLPGAVEVELIPPPGCAGGAAARDEALVLAAIRRWLDLDADPGHIDGFLAGFGLLAPLVAANPGLRVPGSVDGFESAVQTILGQQVSLAAARTFGARLTAAFGGPERNGLRTFPAAGQLAAVGPSELQAAVRITHSRARTVTALAEAVAGGLSLNSADSGAGAAATRAALLALPGVGPWTADYLAVRVFGDRDAYPADDLVLKRALGVGTARAARELSEPWRPWRAYALFHLWTGAAYGAA